MEGKKPKKTVWVENFSLDLHEGNPDYVMMTRHDKKEKRRVLIPLSLVKDIAEALQSLAQ